MKKDNDRLSLALHRLHFVSVRLIPGLLAFTAFLNTLLSYLGIDVPILSYIGGVSLIPLAFLYLASYTMRFCLYHRLFLHYVSLNWVLNIIDYYIGIPVSDKDMFLLYMLITGIFIFLIVYSYVRSRNEHLICK